MTRNWFAESVATAVVAMIRAFFSTPEKDCSYHLDNCVCGLPSFKQPCPNCGHYPMFGQPGDAERTRQLQERWAAKEDKEEWWKGFVTKCGGVASWYAYTDSRRRVVPPGPAPLPGDGSA